MITIATVSDNENVFLFNGKEVAKTYEARATGVDESVEIVATGKEEKLQKQSNTTNTRLMELLLLRFKTQLKN